MSTYRRAIVGLGVAWLVAAGFAGSARAQDTAFTDWTSVDGNVATGTLLGTRVSLSGSHVFDVPVSRVESRGPASTTPRSSPPLWRTATRSRSPDTPAPATR